MPRMANIGWGTGGGDAPSSRIAIDDMLKNKEAELIEV